MFEQNENVSIAFDDQSGVMSVTITGMASVAGVTRPLSHPDLDRTCCMLWDVRDACLSALHPSALMEIAEQYAAWGCQPVTQGVAIVVADREAEILVRLYREILQHTVGCKMAHKITNSMQTARVWLCGGAGIPMPSNDDSAPDDAPSPGRGGSAPARESAPDTWPDTWHALSLKCCADGNKSRSGAV